MRRLPISLMREMLVHYALDARSMSEQTVVNEFAEMVRADVEGLEGGDNIIPMADDRELRYCRLTGFVLAADTGESVVPLSRAAINDLRKQLGIEALADDYKQQVWDDMRTFMKPLLEQWDRWQSQTNAEWKRIHSQLRGLEVLTLPVDDEIERLEQQVKYDAEDGMVHEPTVARLAALYAQRKAST